MKFRFWCCCSAAKSCLLVCVPMDCSAPGFPVLHYLPEFSQPQVHWVDDAIQPSHLLSSPSPLSGSFPTSRLFASGGWSTGALASVSPSNKYSGLEIELNLLNSDSTSIHQQDRGQWSCADALCQAAPFPDQGPQVLSLLSLSLEGISYFTKENASVFILPPAYFTSDPNLPEPCYVSFPPSLLTQWEGLPIFQ